MLFKYDEELPVVAIMLVSYAAFVFVLAMYFVASNGAKNSPIDMAVYGVMTGAISRSRPERAWARHSPPSLRTGSQILNPLLPVSLIAGQAVAAARLQTRGVFCVDPKRIAICGKVRLSAFDKTGTLTKSGLDLLGAVCTAALGGRASQNKGGWQPMVGEKNFASNCDVRVVTGLATCHAVTTLGGELVGPQVEVAGLNATGWKLDASTSPTTVASPKGEKARALSAPRVASPQASAHPRVCGRCLSSRRSSSTTTR